MIAVLSGNGELLRDRYLWHAKVFARVAGVLKAVWLLLLLFS